MTTDGAPRIGALPRPRHPALSTPLAGEAADAWLDDLRRRGDEDSYFFSLDQFLFLTSKPQA